MRSIHFSTIPDSTWRALLVMVLGISFGACGEKTESVTVSGVSAGAYMAVQAHIALSDRISGVGVVAGGPYHCAAGSVANALSQCLSGEGLDTTTLVSFARAQAADGAIANVSNLRDAKVWIFNSPKDVVVSGKVAAALAEFYEEFTSADKIRLIADVDAAHGWPTTDVGNECLVIGGDFLNACGYDAAGAILNYLYDELAPRAVQLQDDIRTIDLSTYFEADSGVSDKAFVFVPNACRDSLSDCRLHISFHGCRQGAEFVEKRFARHAGLNEWAAQNQIVVVYPQIESSPMNPQGCWDWWGYSGADYDQKGGAQIAGVDAIITAFATQKLLHGSAASSD